MGPGNGGALFVGMLGKRWDRFEDERVELRERSTGQTFPPPSCASMREMVSSGAPGDVTRLQQREWFQNDRLIATISVINPGKATKIPNSGAFALCRSK